ncbi:DUF5995 family protein [Nocardioides sp.]|uniref:DUF5995 family protein n=1 Tax=Nocardioides sp. TaxID=35761 RepID=UPI003567400E
MTTTMSPGTVAEVIARLRSIEESLPASDGVAVFNRMYLDVTERVAAELGTGSMFADPAFMAELDVRFAALWLAAYDDAAEGRKVSAAWAPLFEERTTRGIFPIQFALAGMNAHIENDLPLAVIATCRSRDVPLSRGSVRRDYDAVNALLAGAESEIRRSFLTDIEKYVDDEIGPLVHLVSAWNIDKARDLAWISAETMWATRHFSFLSGRHRSMLAHTVGLTSRCLLAPVGIRLP